MSQTLVLPDELYSRLEQTVHQRGLQNVEELLESWQAKEDELANRKRIVERIDAVRAYLFAKYGKMPDSTELVREDRAR